uniref:Uncharacterized protein n=1 Tax=Anguilla anguilla TaxID=7936 RepID=A0A0E9W944_ANGAN
MSSRPPSALSDRAEAALYSSLFGITCAFF